MSWDTAIVFCALLLCNVLSSCFQCITGFGDILCLQILWEVCVSFAPEMFHKSPLSAEDFHFITILSYVRSLFVQSVLAGLLFYQEQRVNKRRLLDGLKPFISDFNATLLLALTAPALIGAAVGAVTLDYLNEAALRIILGTTSFFFALTFLSLQMMKRLERRQLQDVIRNDLADMHISMVLDQQSRQLAAARKAQHRRRARRHRMLRRRRLEQAVRQQQLLRQKQQEQALSSQTVTDGSQADGDTSPPAGEACTSLPILSAQASALPHRMSHDEASSPLTDVGDASAASPLSASAGARIAPGASAEEQALAEMSENMSFDNDSFADTRTDLISLVRQRLADMSTESSAQPVDASMRETAHYTLQLLKEKEASALVPGTHQHLSNLSQKHSRDNIITMASPTHTLSSNLNEMYSPVSSVTPVVSHSTLLAGPSSKSLIAMPPAVRNTDHHGGAGGRDEGDDDDDDDDDGDGDGDGGSSVSTSVSYGTSNVGDSAVNPDERLQRILQRAALTGSFAMPSTVLAVRPTTNVSNDAPKTQRKKAKNTGGHVQPHNESSSTVVVVNDDEDTRDAGDASSPASISGPPQIVLVTANADLLAAQQQSQLRSLQHASTKKRKPLSAHFVRMDGAVVSGAVASSFAAGLLGSYVGTGDAPHVIFGLAMRIGDAVFRKNMPASTIVPGLLRFIMGFTHHHYSRDLLWYYIASVLAGWVGILIGLASPVRAESRGYIASVLTSLLLASFVTLTDSAVKQVLATGLVVVIVAFVIVKEHKPPSLHEEELPPPPSTPTTQAEQIAFARYWDAEQEKMESRQDRKARAFEGGGVDVKRHVRVDLTKPKKKKASDVVVGPVPEREDDDATQSSRVPQKPRSDAPTQGRATEDERHLDRAEEEDGEILPV